MRFDRGNNAMFDVETGALIPLADGDDIPAELCREMGRNSGQNGGFVYARSLQDDSSILENGCPLGTDYNSRNLSAQEMQLQRDREMAMALSLSSEKGPTTDRETEQEMERQRKRQEQETADHAFALSLSGGSAPAPHLAGQLKMEENPYFVGEVSESQVEMVGVGAGEGLAVEREEQRSGGWLDDLSLARALQAMEFEIQSEMRGGAARSPEEEAYNRKENKATKCRRQMVTFSTFLCLVQIGLLVAMIQDDGYAPKSENPMYGPGSYTLVRYGAKVAALIKYENEWWRLITPIFLHAGIIHIISNVGIQLRVGGYLELVFGRPAWLFIYFSSGVYGNMLSCIFLPDAVGIGSSGAVLGMLTSWIVWILFRWFKVPAESRGQRNCQLLVVTAAVVMTLAFSFSDYVDWAAHFGGAIQGAIAAAMLLSKEVEHYYLRWGVRATSGLAFVVSYTWAGVYMLQVMHPSKEFLEYYDLNDDWG